MTLTNKVVLLTGATGGLGRTILQTCLDRDAVVIAVARSHDSLKSLEAISSSAQLFPHAADLSVESEVAGLIEKIRADHGKIDMLIHAAGGFKGGARLQDITIEDWHTMLNLNLTSAFIIIKHVLPLMIENQGGNIIAISATAALDLSVKKGAYVVSKSALNTLIHIIAKEGKSHNIRANAIAPGIIKTKANVQSMPDADSSTWVSPEEIAEMILFLCSPAAKSITGNILSLPLRG